MSCLARNYPSLFKSGCIQAVWCFHHVFLLVDCFLHGHSAPPLYQHLLLLEDTVAGLVPGRAPILTAYVTALVPVTVVAVTPGGGLAETGQADKQEEGQHDGWWWGRMTCSRTRTSL